MLWVCGLAHLGIFGSDFNGFYLEWVLEICWDGDGFFFFLDFGKGIMMGSDLGQDHHAQGGSNAFSRIRHVGGGVSVTSYCFV